MHLVEPQVFLVGQTQTNEEALQAYLDVVGAPEWTTDAPTSAEKLTEVMGRICYRSFKPGLNANVTKVREGSRPYLGNIISTEHGSVMEHGLLNFIFHNVSRVFTHELVRHRPAAVSQESLRYVRLDELGMWMPEWAREDEELMARSRQLVELMEAHQIWMAKRFKLDEEGVGFAHKKHMTSFMRRFAPIGLATSIGWSANVREVRWFLTLRTSPAAEEEMRKVACMVGDIVTAKFPNLFQDYQLKDGQYVSEHPKV